METKKYTLEELERDCTVVSNPVLQQSLDLVRHYNDRFYIKERTVTEKVPVRLAALGGLIPRGIRMEERTVTRYTILRMASRATCCLYGITAPTAPSAPTLSCKALSSGSAHGYSMSRRGIGRNNNRQLTRDN